MGMLDAVGLGLSGSSGVGWKDENMPFVVPFDVGCSEPLAVPLTAGGAPFNVSDSCAAVASLRDRGIAPEL